MVVERRADRALGLVQRRLAAVGGLGERAAERFDQEAVRLLGEREALPLAAVQTTPPAAPEKALRCSASPQRAQAASSGENPAASASLARKASPVAYPEATGSRETCPLLLAVEQAR